MLRIPSKKAHDIEKQRLYFQINNQYIQPFKTIFLPYVEDKEDIVMEVVAEEEELLEGVLGKGIDSPNY